MRPCGAGVVTSSGDPSGDTSGVPGIHFQAGQRGQRTLLLGPGRRAGTNAGVAWTQVQESCGGARLSWGGQAGATGGGVGASWSACRTEVIVASTRG